MTRWVADDEPLEDTDVVLWYVFGIHHITRAEDWPIMPVTRSSFWLKPFGFFDRNPSLDVAPSDAVCHPVDTLEGAEPLVHEHPKHEHGAHEHGGTSTPATTTEPRAGHRDH